MHNQTETVPLRDMVQDIGSGVFIRGIFDLKEAPFDDISEEDWLCLECVNQIIEHYLCIWWLDYKREG